MLVFLSALSILLLALPFTSYHLGWLGLFSFVPVIFLLNLMAQRHYSNRKQFLIIWLVGVVSLYGVLGWSMQTQPERWAFVTGWQAVTGQFLIYTVFVLLFSIQYVIFAGIYLRLKPKLLDWRVFLILPSAWVVSEASRSLFFSISMYGKGSLTGMHWNFGVLGAAIGVTPLVYLSRLIGLFGLSYIVVVIGICIYWIIKKIYQLPAIILSSIVLLAVICFFAWSHPKANNNIQVGYVQLYQSFNNYEGDGYLENLSTIVGKPDHRNDVLVMPEYSNFFAFDGKLNIAQNIAGRTTKPDGVIITSVNPGEENSNHTNRLEAYTPGGDVLTAQDKQFLIPIGEYMPYFVAYLFKLGGMSQPLADFQKTRVIIQGQAANQPMDIHGIKLASLACSGAIAPELYRSIVNHGAELMTNSASLGTFTDATLYLAQSRQLARFMAVANNRAFVQSAAGAYSFVIDNNGDFVSATNFTDTSYGSVGVTTSLSKTPYTVLGEWTILFSCITIGYFIVKKRFNKA